MPQFDIYVSNPVQWGMRTVRAEDPDAALADAQRLIQDDSGGFEMFYDGEFGDTVTLIRVCERGASAALATWRRGDHGLRLFGAELLAAAETVVARCREANLAESMRRLAAAIAKTRQSDG